MGKWSEWWEFYFSSVLPISINICLIREELLKIIADKNQPLVMEYFSSCGSVELVPAEEISNKLLLQSKAEALICRSTIKVNEDLLRNTGVKFVGTCTIGYDHVDRNYLRDRGIGFASAPGCNANSVGEYMAAALLKLSFAHNFELSGKTLGIIGVGNVGSAVAGKAKALGLTVLRNDPPRARQEGMAGFCSLEEVLGASDIVSLHVPLIRSGQDMTLGMAGEDFFRRLKRGAVFINASRGAVAQTEAILQSYAQGRICDYIIDVYENEPDVSREAVANAFIATEHISGHSYDGKMNGTRLVYDAFIRHFFLDNQACPDAGREEYLGQISVPVEYRGLRAVEYALDSCYDIMKDSQEFKAQPERFKELRKNYKKRYEFSHYSVDCSDKEALNILYRLGFSRQK